MTLWQQNWFRIGKNGPLPAVVRGLMGIGRFQTISRKKFKEVNMTLIRSNSSSLFPAFPRFFDDFLSRSLSDLMNTSFAAVNSTLPAVNIKEDGEGFTVEMAAPGMAKEDFKIELENEVLCISAERKSENEVKEGERFTRREFNYQSFQRSFHLPKSTVDYDKIKAKYENGVLTIQIPKREEAKALPARQIAIQ